MSMRFPYSLAPLGHAVLPLGGRWVRPRPLVAVTILGPSGSRARDAILDTAADDTVFPETLAPLLGLDLTQAPPGSGSGAGGRPVPWRYAQITLRLTDGRERRQWPAWVGFTPVPLLYPMLGFAGCLQFFTASFYGDHEEVELEINRLYPGT